MTLEADIQTVLVKLRGLKGQLAVQLTPTSKQSFLPEDFMVPSGAKVFLDGGGRTMTLSGKQFHVSEGATLCLFNIHLTAGSVLSGFGLNHTIIISIGALFRWVPF